MTTAMDGTHFGVTLPQIKRTWQEARETAQELDRLKFDSVWVCDVKARRCR